MDEAAADAAQDETEGRTVADLRAVSQALDALRLTWGHVYAIGHDDKGYWGARPGRPGTTIHRSEAPEELDGLLAEDFAADPS